MPEHKQRYMAQVMHGTIEKTPGGLTKKDIKTVVNENGQTRYVSKKKSNASKNNLSEWNNAVAQAKKNLGIEHNTFVLLKKSGALYKEAARLYYN